MQNKCFIPESPKESSYDLTEEEMFKSIFPLTLEKIENLDEINTDKLYFLNEPPMSQKISPQIKSVEKEEPLNAILLIDDYEVVFNKLKSSQNDQEKENINCYNYNYNIDEYEREDYVIPYFIKNIVMENNYFCPVKNEEGELVVKVEETKKKGKKYKNKAEKKPKKNLSNILISLKKRNISTSKPENKEKKKRGPYKKTKILIKANTEDKCFPFNTGNGILNYGNNSMQLIFNNSSLDYTEENEEIEDITEHNNSNNDFGLWKFTTKKYFITFNGKKKRIKKKRKFKPDDIRKKIKARFHKMIKNIINENLKKAGAKELFDFLPQSFIGNVSKKVNYKALNMTYKEILSTNFDLKLKMDSSRIDNAKLLRNQKVLKYLEENPEISKRAGFDIIKDMKYKDLLKTYFISSQFDDSIKLLKDENESSEYIEEYIYRAKNYIRFYSNFENNEDKKNNVENNEEYH